MCVCSFIIILATLRMHLHDTLNSGKVRVERCRKVEKNIIAEMNLRDRTVKSKVNRLHYNSLIIKENVQFIRFLHRPFHFSQPGTQNG